MRIVALLAEDSKHPMPGMADAVERTGGAVLRWPELAASPSLGWPGMELAALRFVQQHAAGDCLVLFHVRLGRIFRPDWMRELVGLAHDRGAWVVSWCDDPAPTEASFRCVARLLSYVDFALFTDRDHARLLQERACVRSGYLPSGYGPDTFYADQDATEDLYACFVGTNYHLLDGGDRERTVQAVRRTGVDLRVFGEHWRTRGVPAEDGWVPPDRFRDLCHRSRVTVGMGLRDDLPWYTSDRMMRAMGSGAVYAPRWFPGIEGLGVVHGENALVWHDKEELAAFLLEWTGDGKTPDRRRIREAAAGHALGSWTWDTWMGRLVDLAGQHGGG